MEEPDEITVTVHGARGLKPKKAGRCKFSTIFGVGSKKYRTSVVKDYGGNPSWHEDMDIVVPVNATEVFFNVTEKEDVLGIVTVPMSMLANGKVPQRTTPLQPHKKSANPQGALIYSIEVKKWRPAGQTPVIRSNSSGQSSSTLARLRHSLAISPGLGRRAHNNNKEPKEKKESRASAAFSNLNKKLSKSIHDIFSFGSRHGDQDEDKEGDAPKVSKFRSINAGMEQVGVEPVVTRITPSLASTKGDTRLVIEGRNLGVDKDDIVELMLCEMDLTDTVEYSSPEVIYCTTKPCMAGRGDLWLETKSGGQAILKDAFTFADCAGSITPRRKNSVEVSVTPSTPTPAAVATPVIRESPAPPSPAPRQAASTLPNFTQAQKQELLSPSWSLHRSQSQKTPGPSSQNCNSLPRIHSSNELPSQQGRFRKNFMKHTRRASESALVASAKEKEKDVMDPLDDESFGEREPDASVRKAPESGNSGTSTQELLAQIDRLYKENLTLKQDKEDLTKYIEKLVTKVMIHCPEALHADDGNGPAPSSLQKK